MATDLIRYDLMVQDALRGVVRRVLADAARDGIPGEHYFHISFRTKERGVRLSDRMRERYPETMTIVLQHQFWDLSATEEAFEAGLSFGGVPEKVRVPYAAITEFFDESVQFGLRFEGAAAETAGDTAGPTPAPATAKPEKAPAPAPAALPSAPASPPKAVSKPAPVAKSSVTTLPHPLRSPQKETAGDPGPDAGGEKGASDNGEDGGKVLSIDAFRKKP